MGERPNFFALIISCQLDRKKILSVEMNQASRLHHFYWFDLEPITTQRLNNLRRKWNQRATMVGDGESINSVAHAPVPIG